MEVNAETFVLTIIIVKTSASKITVRRLRLAATYADTSVRSIDPVKLSQYKHVCMSLLHDPSVNVDMARRRIHGAPIHECSNLGLLFLMTYLRLTRLEHHEMEWFALE